MDIETKDDGTVARRVRSNKRSKELTTDTHKYCAICDDVKPKSSFPTHKYRKRSGEISEGFGAYCRPHTREYASQRGREYRLRNYEKVVASGKVSNRKAVLKRSYGITVEDWDRMFESQNGCCAICGSKDPGKSSRAFLHVDHCHDTMRIRGLLCHGCNIGLGAFKDSTLSLNSAIDYLKSEVTHGIATPNVSREKKKYSCQVCGLPAEYRRSLCGSPDCKGESLRKRSTIVFCEVCGIEVKGNAGLSAHMRGHLTKDTIKQSGRDLK